MELSEENLGIYKSIGLARRYKALIDKYSDRGTFKYDNDRVMSIFLSLGFKAQYEKKEDFFAVEVVEESGICFTLNISLKYNILEDISYASSCDTGELLIGGSVGWKYKELMDASKDTRLDENERKVVLFSSYDELEEILKESLAIYEDFKREVIKVYGKENNKKEEE